MGKIYKDISETIGNTPLVKLNRITEGLEGTVLLKLESFNPLSSVKDRIGFSMINAAITAGELKPGMTIVEPTSGNTGIGLAFVAAAKGFKAILVMPDSMSLERRKLLVALGAELVLTPGGGGMKGAIDHAAEMVEKDETLFMPQQFKNPANPEIHYLTTGKEIFEDTGGNVDAFVAGIGTGGTITGVGKLLKEKRDDIKVIAVEPEGSPVLSGGQAGSHKIQGIGAGFVPDVLNTDIYDEVIKVKNEDAFNTARSLAQKEGILVGISSGANVFAAMSLLKRDEYKNKTIVTIAPDTGERYLSTALFDF